MSMTNLNLEGMTTAEIRGISRKPSSDDYIINRLTNEFNLPSPMYPPIPGALKLMRESATLTQAQAAYTIHYSDNLAAYQRFEEGTTHIPVSHLFLFFIKLHDTKKNRNDPRFDPSLPWATANGRINPGYLRTLCTHYCHPRTAARILGVSWNIFYRWILEPSDPFYATPHQAYIEALIYLLNPHILYEFMPRSLDRRFPLGLPQRSRNQTTIKRTVTRTQVRDLRYSLGITQREAAKHLGISLALYQRYEISEDKESYLEMPEARYAILLDLAPLYEPSPEVRAILNARDAKIAERNKTALQPINVAYNPELQREMAERANQQPKSNPKVWDEAAPPTIITPDSQVFAATPQSVVYPTASLWDDDEPTQQITQPAIPLETCPIAEANAEHWIIEKRIRLARWGTFLGYPDDATILDHPRATSDPSTYAPIITYPTTAELNEYYADNTEAIDEYNESHRINNLKVATTMHLWSHTKPHGDHVLTFLLHHGLSIYDHTQTELSSLIDEWCQRYQTFDGVKKS